MNIKCRWWIVYRSYEVVRFTLSCFKVWPFYWLDACFDIYCHVPALRLISTISRAIWCRIYSQLILAWTIQTRRNVDCEQTSWSYLYSWRHSIEICVVSIVIEEKLIATSSSIIKCKSLAKWVTLNKVIFSTYSILFPTNFALFHLKRDDWWCREITASCHC